MALYPAGAGAGAGSSIPLPIQTGRPTARGRGADIGRTGPRPPGTGRRRPRRAAGTVDTVLAQIAVIPSAPLLVPELSGPGAREAEPVRAAVLAAGEALAAAAPRWVALGVGDVPGAGPQEDCARTGDLGAYGVPVPVVLPGAGDAGGSPMPLSMLIAGWLAGRVTPAPVAVTPLIPDPASDPSLCRVLGSMAAVSEDLLGGDDPVGLLVVADGANALSPSAPGGGERESAWRLQRLIDGAVAAGTAPGLAALGAAEARREGIGTRAAWQVLGGVLDQCPVDRVQVRYTGAPFGVGYTVATLQPEPRR